MHSSWTSAPPFQRLLPTLLLHHPSSTSDQHRTVQEKFAFTAWHHCSGTKSSNIKRHQPSSFQKFLISSIPSFPCSSLCKYNTWCTHFWFSSYCYCKKNFKYWIKEVRVQGTCYHLTMPSRNIITEYLFARLNISRKQDSCLQHQLTRKPESMAALIGATLMSTAHTWCYSLLKLRDLQEHINCCPGKASPGTHWHALSCLIQNQKILPLSHPYCWNN